MSGVGQYGPRAVFTGLVALVVGWLLWRSPESFPARWLWLWFGVAGLVLVFGPVWWWWHRRSGSAGAVRWRSWRGRRNQGVASRTSIMRHASGLTLRRSAVVLRPSLGRLGPVARLRVPLRQLGTPVARVGWLRIWSSVEDVTLRVGGPRSGKTGELNGRILDAPGGVIATSTRPDQITTTAALRELRGPVGVFNPSGLGGIPSSVTFNPLSGCEQARTAVERATDLLSVVSAEGVENGAFWADQARRFLAAMLHLVARDGGSMDTVSRWISDPATHRDAIVRASHAAGDEFRDVAQEWVGMDSRTRSSVTATTMPALGWLQDPTARAAACADSAGGRPLDVGALITGNGTLYLLGAEEGMTAPLVTALTGYIAREARRLASLSATGRLDPPLTMVLDEMALICPIPLDRWTADMGGRGVTIHMAAQSAAQLRQRWGADGAAALINNCATILVYGAMKDAGDLKAWSDLAGERDELIPEPTADGGQRWITRRVPVCSPAAISQLAPQRVLIFRRGLAPAFGRVQMAWRRRDVRRHRAAVKAMERARRRRATWNRWSTRGATVVGQTREAASFARDTYRDVFTDTRTHHQNGHNRNGQDGRS